jgi:hypothetical protein
MLRQNLLAEMRKPAKIKIQKEYESMANVKRGLPENN